jgi:hypothetical protein
VRLLVFDWIPVIFASREVNPDSRFEPSAEVREVGSGRTGECQRKAQDDATMASRSGFVLLLKLLPSFPAMRRLIPHVRSDSKGDQEDDI